MTYSHASEQHLIATQLEGGIAAARARRVLRRFLNGHQPSNRSDVLHEAKRTFPDTPVILREAGLIDG
ncbi:MAG: hypothetical protein JW940_37695 [Polyangiaceae bacterium]|nr:hypothetical protein [Polyangiaceae bacterium]